MQIDPPTPSVDALVAEVATVSAELAPGAVGRVELRGSTWTARNVSVHVLAPGARCVVVRVDGLTVDVTREGAR